MPDITMCGTITCPLRYKCYRSECSGTKPSPRRQSYFLSAPFEVGQSYFMNEPVREDDVTCHSYWPIDEDDNA